jgi:hypothetical protein
MDLAVGEAVGEGEAVAVEHGVYGKLRPESAGASPIVRSVADDIESGMVSRGNAPLPFVRVPIAPEISDTALATAGTVRAVSGEIETPESVGAARRSAGQMSGVRAFVWRPNTSRIF